MRIFKICFLVCSIFWISSVFIIAFPLKFPFVDNKYSATCLLVTGQSTTGPDIHVLKGANELRDAIPLPHPKDLNTDEIEMVGKSIYEWVEYPDYYMFDYVITGNYEGLTTMYQETGFGSVPIFQTNTIKPVGKLSAWVEVKFGSKPILFVGILLWVLPVILFYLCYCFFKNKKRTI